MELVCETKKNLCKEVCILKSKKEALENEVIDKNQIIDKVNKELDGAKMTLKKFEGKVLN